LPAWFALIVQVPTPVWLTEEPLVLPLSEHTEAEVASIVSETGKPDVVVAVTTYAVPPTVAASGAVDVKLIVCAALPTANDCCT